MAVRSHVPSAALLGPGQYTVVCQTNSGCMWALIYLVLDALRVAVTHLMR